MSCCDIQLGASVVRMVQAQDISPRLRAEAVEEEKDRTLRKPLYGLDEGLLVLGTDSKPVFVNAAAAQILGLPEPHLHNLESKSGWDEIRARVAPLLGSDYENFAINVYGAANHVDVRTKLATGANKTERLLILRDGTKQRENAQKLLLLQRAVYATSNGVVIVDAKDANQPIIT